MTQAVFQLEPPPLLAALLQREFTRESLPQVPGLAPELAERLWHKGLGAPLCNLALRGGKEFRADLVHIAWQLGGGRGDVPPELIGAIEALHLGSLIIDDIEDGSARRRGGPALHRQFGVPVALNAGNWLYFLPGELIQRLELEPRLELELRRAIDRGVLECHYGQALDLTVRVTELKQRDVPAVVLATTRLKTGSLMELAARVGAIAAGADARTIAALGALGCELGIGLQMLDDLSGIRDEKRCHKGHEDLIGARASWVWAWLAESRDSVAYCRLRALAESVAAHDTHPEALAEQLREFVTAPGETALRERLTSALTNFGQALPESRGFAPLTQWVRRLLSNHG